MDSLLEHGNMLDFIPTARQVIHEQSQKTTSLGMMDSTMDLSMCEVRSLC